MNNLVFTGLKSIFIRLVFCLHIEPNVEVRGASGIAAKRPSRL